MYCPNCGNELNGNKFCVKCGYNTEKKEATNVVNNTTTAPKKSNKAAITVVLIVVFLIIASIIGIIALVFFFSYKFVTNFGTKEYIGINDIKIASIYKVLGEEKEVCGFSGSIGDESTRTYIDYCNNLSDDEEQKYVEYLMENEGFSFVQGSYKYTLTKEENDVVYVVTIDNNDGITYSCSDKVGNMSPEENIEM